MRLASTGAEGQRGRAEHKETRAERQRDGETEIETDEQTQASKDRKAMSREPFLDRGSFLFFYKQKETIVSQSMAPWRKRVLPKIYASLPLRRYCSMKLSVSVSGLGLNVLLQSAEASTCLAPVQVKNGKKVSASLPLRSYCSMELSV